MTALLVQAGMRGDPDALRSTLARYAVDLGKPGQDPIFGKGIVRARPPCR